MINRIISNIEDKLQSTGFFPSLRFNDLWKYYRTENNIFSLASTAFILKEIQTKTEPISFEKINSIINLIKKNYPLYQNKDGRPTYNFYPTLPSKHFPNGYVMQYFKHFKLPDDIDDTALIYFTENKTQAEVQSLKDLTAQFCTENQIYDTWYGKNMPKETDVCALLNLMYLFETYKLQYTPIDTNTFRFLETSFHKIKTNNFEISRHYAHPSLIVYHYSRFLYKHKNSPLESLRKEIPSLIYHLKKEEKNDMFNLVLDICLLKMGKQTPDISIENINFNGFYTFIAAPLAPFSNKLAKKMAAKPIFQFFYSSEIQNLALIAEYLSLKTNASSSFRNT